jgi:putative hydrolase of the HAD superfamily
MHIITNGFSEVQRKKLFNCGLSGFFTKVFISEEIQSNKPHRQIFEYALKSTNAKKKRSVMIGDNWETDIEGALKFGMDQIMFLNHDQNAIPVVTVSIRSASECCYLELKPLIKTYFVQKIADLVEIL